MQKLSSTWKQQKQLRARQESQKYPKPTAVAKTDEVNRKTTKRLGQHAVAIGAPGSKLIGQFNQSTANQDADETKQAKASGRSVPEKTFRRSPRLKGGEVEVNVPLTTSKQPTSHQNEGHHGCSFSSSFSGDLDDDMLQAIEEAEANFCHQNQHTETSKDTGSLLQGMAAAVGTNLNTGAPLDTFQNSEDLFTEIKPSTAGENVKFAAADISSSRKPTNKNCFSTDIQLDPEKQLCELKMPRGTNQPSDNKSAKTSCAILNERTLNNDKTNCTGLNKLRRIFTDSSGSAEKENLPAGQVYCLDSQSQNESPESKKSDEQIRELQKQLVDQDQLMLKERKRRDDKRRLGCISGSTQKPVLATSAKKKSSWQGDDGICSPPTSTNPLTHPTPDPLLLSSWGLPEQVLAQYQRCHVTRMFPWQAECLAIGQVLEGGNLVYSAPTSAGKTLVAEFLILKRVLETKKKALFILPFVSVAREKMFYLQSMFQDAGVCVGGYMGSESPSGGFQTIDVAVCTIEKANSLVNRLLEENKVDQLGIIVVDELHMVGDAHRGYLLELLLTKIRYITKRTQDAVRTMPMESTQTPTNPVPEVSIQIVGMSATLPNLDQLAKWLDADLYRTDFRPVPLTQTLKVGHAIYDASLTKLRDVQPPHIVPGDEDQILALCLETLAIGCSVLIFCPTKNWCEKLGETMAREIARLTGMIPNTCKDPSLSINLNKQSLQDVIEQLKRTPVGLDPVLHRTVPCGVAYHHAGLSFDERDIIEGAFRQGALKILVATSTLSSGVNLPARRVIIRSVMFHRKVLDPLVYQQMSGRAGRKGVDTQGESILICKPNERDKAVKLMQADLPPVQSCLKKQGQDLSNSMKRAILEVIASGAASTLDDVHRYTSCTLLAASLPCHQDNPDSPASNSTSAAIHTCLQFLQTQEFVLLQKVRVRDETKDVLRPTQLGSATLASALSPDEAIIVFTELQRARKNFVLENDLHLLYQVTPIYDQGFQPDWYEFMCTWENLSTDKRRVAELVGVEERFLIRAAQGALSTHTAKLQHALAIHKRFYTTLILNDLVREMPVVAAARKYGCARGQLQSLQQSAATFAGMVTAFCSKLGWTHLELLLAQYQSRLTFGVQRELCDLVRISLLNAFRARLVYNSGFASVAAVASANPSDIEGVLRKAVPFQSSRKAIDEHQFEVDERKQSRCIWATGRKGLTEQQAALMIVQEAKELLQADLGALGVKWKPTEEPLSSSPGGDAKGSSSRIQPPSAKGSSSSSKSGDDVMELRVSPSRIQPPNAKGASLSSRSGDNNQTLPRASPSIIPPPMTDCISDDNVNQENMMTSGSLQKHQKTESLDQVQSQSRVLRSSSWKLKTDDSSNAIAQLESKLEVDDKSASDSQQGVRNSVAHKEALEEDSASRMKPVINSSAKYSNLVDKPQKQPIVRVPGVCTRAKGLGRTLTVEADVHIDASSSVIATTPDNNSAQKLETSTKSSSQTSKKKSASIPSHPDCVPIVSPSSHQLVTSVCEKPQNELNVDNGKTLTSQIVNIEDVNTPKSSKTNPLREPEISPELFSLPVSPIEETKAATTDPGINTPVNNQVAPKILGSFSTAFSPLDSQMLQFLEEQEHAYYQGKSPTPGQTVLPQQSQVAPVPIMTRSKVRESQASSVVSPLDPKVLRLTNECQDAGSKKEEQVLPVEERKEVPVSFTLTQQSSPSYSPLDSQALLFHDSSSELRLSPGQELASSADDDLQFTSSFPTLDSQVLKIIDEFHTTKNELAAKSASPALTSLNKSRTSGTSTNAKASRKSSWKKSILKGRSSSRKKQKLVLTFCQADSPYSEFFQDEEITLDLAETLECSFVIDRTESTLQETGRRESCILDSRRNPSSTMSMRCTTKATSDKAESPVYSQLEADMALAAEWSDFFSFDEGQQEAAESPPKSNVQIGLSESSENHKTNCEKQTEELKSLKAGPNISDLHTCNVQTPQQSLHSATKVVKSAQIGKNIGTKPSREDVVMDSVEKYFNDQLSPGTVAMLDLFAGDSDTKSLCYSAKTADSTDVQTSAANSITRPVVADPTCGTKLYGKSRQQSMANQSKRQDLDAKSDCEKTKQLKGEKQRKRRSSEAIINLVREDIPTKKTCQEACQDRSPPVKDGTPDARRKSDDDFISPTPPKGKPNTPKLLKGTPKQRPLREVPAEADTPRSLRLRERSRDQHKEPLKIHKVVRGLEDTKNTPRQRKRKSPSSNPPVSQRPHASSLNTPRRDSPAPIQNDFNTACDESQLHLNLDIDSSFEIEPPTPPTQDPASTKPSRVSPRRFSSRDDQPTASLRKPRASPKVSSTQGAFTIIDVCSSKELFQTFLEEWRSKSRYSLSVACERYQPQVQGGGIGAKFRKAASRPIKANSVDCFQVGDESLVVIGLSVCWEDKDAYFISFQKETCNVDPDDSLAQPQLDSSLPIHQRLQEVKATLETEKTGNQTQDVCQLAFDCKEQYKVLSRGCGILLSGHLVDPKVAHWLLDPGAKESNLQGLVTYYVPLEGHILEGISGGVGLGSLGLSSQGPGTGRLRSATESVLVLALMDHLVPALREDGLHKTFMEVEMPCMRVLARMELTGFGFNQEECEAQKAVMQAKLTALEEEAYQMAGHTFSLTSPQDIAQVLYVELKLPPNGDPTLPLTGALRKTLGARGGKPRLPKHFSTCKDSLEKLRPFHPLPGIVLEWRRITAAVTKVVYPLLKERKPEAKLGGERIYSSCQTHTATGRVCLSDPNIQAIPRDFEIQMPSTIGESPPMGAGVPPGLSHHPTRARRKHPQAREHQSRGTRMATEGCQHPQAREHQSRGTRMATEGCESGPSCFVSVRHAFCPFQGGVLLAADYSQLELRILAHLSKDIKLAAILNSGGDVFKCIAAQWKQIDRDQVSSKQRQQAKQICYGMVYGIGAKALGQQLGESEEDAAAFMESFKTQYRGMKSYIRDAVDSCRASGYAETILHRRRYLPAISHTNPAARSQAERQAVNTTIQGSAADLVKVAMVNIDRRLKEEFPNTMMTHRHREGYDTGLMQRRKSTRCTAATPSGAYLVLQLHDELIYEVHREDVTQVAQLVKMEMESAITLSVRLPVKVKAGPTWGSMEDFDV